MCCLLLIHFVSAIHFLLKESEIIYEALELNGLPR